MRDLKTGLTKLPYELSEAKAKRFMEAAKKIEQAPMDTLNQLLIGIGKETFWMNDVVNVLSNPPGHSLTDLGYYESIHNILLAPTKKIDRYRAAIRHVLDGDYIGLFLLLMEMSYESDPRGHQSE